MQAPEAISVRDELDLVELLRRVVARKWIVVGIGTLGLAFSILYLHLAVPTYSAVLKVTPAASSGVNSNSKLAGLGGLAAIAGVSVGTTANGATPFELYLDRLNSRDVADELALEHRIMRTVFEDSWDNRRDTWREPGGGVNSLARMLRPLLGVPNRPWREPRGADLQTYLRDELSITKPGVKDSPITKIAFDHKDPVFAQYLLQRLDKLTDDRVRKEALNRSTRYAAYLSGKLQETLVADHRVALSDALRVQEESIMMASSGLPYAALPIEAPTVSDRPTKPEALAVLAAGLLAGIVAGLATALVDWHTVRQRLAYRAID